MVARTYLWGYNGQRRTRKTLDGYWQIAAMHPEFRRRMWALCDAALDSGHDLGPGGGTRTFNQQLALYKARHGIGVAPAGGSYHEEEATPQGAIAVDLVGDLEWNIANCKRFGLDHLGAMGEKWHDQLLELPRSRSQYKVNPSAFPIRVWNLPGAGTTPDPPIVVPKPPVKPPPVITPGVTPAYLMEEDVMLIARVNEPNTPNLKFAAVGNPAGWVFCDRAMATTYLKSNLIRDLMTGNAGMTSLDSVTPVSEAELTKLMGMRVR